MPIFELPGGSEAAAAVIIGDGMRDHVTAAINRLPEQFKNKTNIRKLVTLLVEPAQELEEVFWDLILYRTADTATDATLDLIGKIVGELRGGKADDLYRRYIKARILTNRSHGLVETLIRIVRLIHDDPVYVHVQSMPIATVVVTLADTTTTDAVADALIDFLKQAVSAGVRIDLATSPDPIMFLWDEPGHGFDEGSFADLRSNV